MRSQYRLPPNFALVLLLAPGLASAGHSVRPQLDTEVRAATARVSSERLHDTVAKLVSFGTRNTFSEALGPKRGVFAARDWIAAQLREIAARSGGRMTVSLDGYVQQPDGKRIARAVEISSVVAELKGDEPGGRTYVISSHYDSRNSSNEDTMVDAPGADDNASGTAVVLEAARLLAKTPTHANIIFAIYDSEEQGLLGSGHHAQSLKTAGRDVQGDLNNDIVGASRGDHGEVNANFVRIFSESLPLGSDPRRVNLLGSENDSPSRELARYAKEVGDTYGTGFSGALIFRADRFLRGGDHESFNAVGFPAIRFVEPVETFAHQHQNPRVENGIQFGDFINFMDFQYLAKVARYNIAVIANLARGPGLPQHASILTKELTNDTSLSWAPVAGAVSYEVVRRLTTESVWTHSQSVGNVTQVTLPFSKDNWLFGIRAVDAQGHRGVPASPSPKSN